MTPSLPRLEKGSRHWWLQRVSAVALIPLTLWFVMQILARIGDAHGAAAAWVAHPGVALGLIAYLGAAFFHSLLGLQVIVEDYVSGAGARAKILRALKWAHLLAAALAAGSVLRVAVG